MIPKPGNLSSISTKYVSSLLKIRIKNLKNCLQNPQKLVSKIHKNSFPKTEKSFFSISTICFQNTTKIHFQNPRKFKKYWKFFFQNLQKDVSEIHGNSFSRSIETCF